MEFFLLINKYLLFINKFTYICPTTILNLIMKAKLDFSFKILHIVCWIVFIGLAIETGGYVTNAFVTLFINPEWATHFWGNLDLSSLFQYDLGLFICLIVIIITLSTLKTILFYNTISLFHKKKFNLDHPFNEAVNYFLFNFAVTAITIGLFTYAGSKFSNWLVDKGNTMPSLELLKLGGSDVWLFMGITLLVIAKIFKKGIQIQTENELTI